MFTGDKPSSQFNQTKQQEMFEDSIYSLCALNSVKKKAAMKAIARTFTAIHDPLMYIAYTQKGQLQVNN